MKTVTTSSSRPLRYKWKWAKHCAHGVAGEGVEGAGLLGAPRDSGKARIHRQGWHAHLKAANLQAILVELIKRPCVRPGRGHGVGAPAQAGS